MNRLASDSQDLRQQIQSFEQNLFQTWVKKITEALRDRDQQQKYQMTG
jgi:hypothetical protein